MSFALALSGDVLLLFGGGMLVFGFWELIENAGEYNFLMSSLICLTFGAVFKIVGEKERPSARSILIATISLWVLTPLFSSLPFFLSYKIDVSLVQAFFEAVSGITTTGATIFPKPEDLSINLLIWRAILQWVGGIGIVVTIATLFPLLRVGGMQLFASESISNHTKFTPKLAQTAYLIIAVYLGFTILCFFGLMTGGMPPFDALLHAMTTISTGGFSTSSESITTFSNPVVDTTIIVFMLIGSMPFLLFMHLLRARSFKNAEISQIFLFFSIAVLATAASVLWLFFSEGFELLNAIRLGIFNTVSVVTGTGFKTADYSTWGGFILCMFFFLSLIGGCSGSTSCGIKIFHIQILYKSLKAYTRKAFLPHKVWVETYNRREITPEVTNAIHSIVLSFLILLVALSYFLYMSGLDPLTSISAAASSLANLGPGLGEVVGPSSNFAQIKDSTLMVLSLGMIAGRLEFLPFIMLVFKN